MATLERTVTHAGHTISIEFKAENGIIVQLGRGQGLTARRGFNTSGVYQLGSIYPAEHVPLRFEGTLTLERFLVRKDAIDEISRKLVSMLSLKDNDPPFAAAGTGEADIDADGVARGGDIMRLGLIDIVVRDKFKGN